MTATTQTVRLGGPFTPLARVLNSLHLRRTTLQFFTESARRADVLEVPIVAGRMVYFVNAPSGIRHVLVDAVDRYTRADNLEVPMFADAVGAGMLASDGDAWRRIRRMNARPFRRASVEALRGSIESRADRCLATWAMWRPTHEAVDLFPRLVALTAAVSVKCFFDFDLDEHDSLTLARSLMTGQDRVFSELLAAVRTPLWIPTPLNRRYRRGLAVIEELFRRILRARLDRRDDAPDDLLAALVGFRDAKTGAPLADRELRDQIVTALVAAPENMATSLSWSLTEIAATPALGAPFRVADRAQERARFFREILRLYPGVPVITRRAVADDRIDDHRIPAGGLVVISPYVLHRDPRFWSHATKLDVDRPEYEALGSGDERLRYIPFGVGPRQCIGDHFSRIVLDVLLAALVTRFDAEPDASRPAIPQPRVNLRPVNGLWMRLHRRSP